MHVVDLGTLFLSIWTVVVHRAVLDVNSILAFLSFYLLPLLSVVVMPYWYPTPMYLATTLAILMLFILFHGEVNQKRLEQELRLAENERRLAEKERDLAESRISMTLSQLQPHFLYNVLNTIYHLCGRDPKLAQEAVEKFAEYLRNNMKSLEQREPIPFEEEYQHIQTYLALEKMRFRTLEVIYDIDFVAFMVPPLSIQPLVENTVKHGVTKKRGGGTVTISTRETEDAYLVIVADTGVGFVLEHDLADGKVHIGIQNVRERLHHMMGGTLSITSIPGSGTTAVVTIPK